MKSKEGFFNILNKQVFKTMNKPIILDDNNGALTESDIDEWAKKCFKLTKKNPQILLEGNTYFRIERMMWEKDNDIRHLKERILKMRIRIKQLERMKK